MSESAFDPAEYIRGFSDEQIVEHLVGTMRIVDRVIEQADVPEALFKDVFAVAQAMRAAMQPKSPQQGKPRIARVG